MTEYRHSRPNYLSRFLIFIGIFFLLGSLLLSVAMLVTPSISNNKLTVDKLTQMLATFGMFFVTSWVFLKSFREPVLRYWQMTKSPAAGTILKTIILTFCFIIIGTALIYINKQIPLGNGSFAKWVTDSENEVNKMTESFLDMHGPGDLWFNLLLVAIVPAFCEEVFFRGTLQRLLHQWTKNPHISIVITSLLFALMHFKFTQVLPIFAISIFLGYLYQYTGNIWYNIIAHLINNGLVVVMLYFGKGNKTVEGLVDDTYVPNILLILLAAGISALLFYNLYKNRTIETTEPEADAPEYLNHE